MVASALIDRSAPDPAAHVAREDAWENTLRGLSSSQRAVVVLRCRHSMNFAEIGRVLGLSDSGANRIWLETVAQLRSSGKYRALCPN